MMDLVAFFRFTLAALAVCVIAWAFGDVASRAVQSRLSQKDRPVQLTILHWGDQGEERVVQSLVDQFEKQHPLTKITRIPVTADDFESKLKTMMAAGTPPDLFYLRPDDLADLASMKLIAPIDNRFAKEPDSWKDDFFPFLINGFRYDITKQMVGTGPLYGLPKDFQTAGFYVNLDLFEKAGVPVPYRGWTWDDFESDMKKITALSHTRGFEDRDIYGGFFQLWSDTIRNIVWTYGGEFFGPGGFRDVTLDSPQSQSALQMIFRTHIIDKTIFNSTGLDKDGGQEFFVGDIGCIGPIGRWMTPRYKDITKFKWDVVPMPHQTNQVSQIFYNAWTMSSQTRHPDESFELMKFLCGKEGQIAQARLGLSIPSLKSVAYSQDFLNPPGLPKVNTQMYLDAIPFIRLAAMPREPEFVRILEDRINDSIQLGKETPMQSAQAIKAKWIAELDSPLRRNVWAPMRWSIIISITVSVLVIIVGFLIWRATNEHLGPIDRAQQRAGFTFIAPWLLGFLLFALGPMITSLLLSFSRWSAMVPVSSAEFVGSANYRQILVDSSFYKSIQVTFYFVILAVPIGQMAAMAIALLMNTKIRGIEIFRTIYFVPSVVSGAALSVMWLQIFNNQYGIFNRLLSPVAHLFHTTPPDWFGADAGRWAVPGFVIMGLWGVGSGMIIYLAGLKGISVSLYEAATIDGAGAARRFWNVTLPMLSPLLFYNLVMGIIGSFQIFTQAYVMNVKGSDDSTLFYVVYLYRQAFSYHNMGYASALAWILFLLILGLTLFVFASSRRLVYYEDLKS